MLDAIAGERPHRAPRRRHRRLLRPRVLVPAAAALAAVVVAVVIALGGGGDEGAPGFEVALQPVAGETASGRALLASADAGINMRLWVRGLPRDPGIVYEVLCDAPGWTASAGRSAQTHVAALMWSSTRPPVAASTTRSASCAAPARARPTSCRPTCERRPHDTHPRDPGRGHGARGRRLRRRRRVLERLRRELELELAAEAVSSSPSLPPPTAR